VPFAAFAKEDHAHEPSVHIAPQIQAWGLVGLRKALLYFILFQSMAYFWFSRAEKSLNLIGHVAKSPNAKNPLTFSPEHGHMA
jgi:hypothetical protein